MPLPRLHTALALAAVLLALAGCSKEAAAPEARPAPQVTVLTVQGQDIPFTPSFVAQTESSRQVNIVARVSGFLDRIAYQEGFAMPGQRLIISAGVPLGTPGATNMLRIAFVGEDRPDA